MAAVTWEYWLTLHETVPPACWQVSEGWPHTLCGSI